MPATVAKVSLQPSTPALSRQSRQTLAATINPSNTALQVRDPRPDYCTEVPPYLESELTNSIVPFAALSGPGPQLALATIFA